MKKEMYERYEWSGTREKDEYTSNYKRNIYNTKMIQSNQEKIKHFFVRKLFFFLIFLDAGNVLL